MKLLTLTPEDLRQVFPEELLTDPEEAVEIFQKALASGKLYVIGSKHYKMRQQKVQEINNMLQIGLQFEQTAPHISAFAALKAIEREVGVDEEGIIAFGAAIEEQAGLKMKQQEVEQQLQQMQSNQVEGGPVGGQ